MILRPQIPAWLQRAREMAARVPSPAGAPFAAKKQDDVAKLYIFDMIGKDPWSGSGVDPAEVAKTIDGMRGAKELEIRLNSPGGYISDGIAIYNTIRSFEGKRTVYVDGLAASIASVIALAGDRIITGEGASWMIHEPMGGIFSFGTADQIEEDARKEAIALRSMRENILSIYTENTGQSLAKLSGWMAVETWMTPAEALERGFTDEIAATPKPEEEEIAPAAALLPLRPAAAVSPGAVVDLARARVAQLKRRFPGASPGADGQPTARPKNKPG
jgi:ATP-dependent Clp protease protease subunit